MLTKSLICILVGAAILNLCNGQCYVVPEDLNTKWRPADVVEQVAHDFYQSLALGPEDNGDIEKRFVSVYSHTLFLYIASNKTDETDRIKDAAHRTRNKLDSSADQLAGPIRALISLAMLIIEGPLTDVQVACPYYVRQHECKEILSKLQADKIKQCAGYKDNIELYNRATSLINSCGMENLLEELATESNKGGDMEAINLFTDFASIKYASTIRSFRNIMQSVKNIHTSCHVFSFI
ncbi:PREDICTED: uncharacterized protein LOC106118597 [Papilio xuthus]|uniref:Uncharacterized protein LOC106118597 n=1 Tax=Papilio xuthus TaxID=66420 RepID=A0AAJ7E9Y8_PAPXU|nr:PREDICTED: uncharacterized protein LOC106118597 [Papilio xuthus]